MKKEVKDIQVVSAVLPTELVLGISGYSGCQGDDCNSDDGGCQHDASCGQDC